MPLLLYDQHVDRLDSWLNGQVGWRRAVLVWMQLCPWAVQVGVPAWAFFTPGTPRFDLVLLEVLGWSVLAAALLTAAILALRGSIAARYSAKPMISVRLFLAALFMVAAYLLQLFIEGQPPSWRNSHRALWVAAPLIDLAAVAVLVGAVWRLRRASGPGLHDGEHAMAAGARPGNQAQ
jgi:hypothetical protein